MHLYLESILLLTVGKLESYKKDKMKANRKHLIFMFICDSVPLNTRQYMFENKKTTGNELEI